MITAKLSRTIELSGESRMSLTSLYLTDAEAWQLIIEMSTTFDEFGPDFNAAQFGRLEQGLRSNNPWVALEQATFKGLPLKRRPHTGEIS